MAKKKQDAAAENAVFGEMLSAAHHAELTELNEAKAAADAAEAEALALLETTSEHAAYKAAEAQAKEAHDAFKLYVAFLFTRYSIDQRTDGLSLDGTIKRNAKGRRVEGDLVPARSVSRARTERARAKADARNQN